MKALPEPDGIPVRDEPVNPAFVEVRIVDGTNPVTFIIVEAVVIVPAIPSQDFYLLRHTTAPAVLTENFFMDCHPDCAFLLSKEGQQSLVDLHVDGICGYLSEI